MSLSPITPQLMDYWVKRDTDTFNRDAPIGRLVVYKQKNGEPVTTRTRSAAWSDRGALPVVMLDGFAAPVRISEVSPVLLCPYCKAVLNNGEPTVIATGPDLKGGAEFAHERCAGSAKGNVDG